MDRIEGRKSSIMIVVGFNILLSITDRKIDRLRGNKRCNTIKWIDLTDIYRSLYPKTTEDIIFSSADGTVSNIDFMLRHKLILNRFKKIDHTKWVLKTQKNEVRNQ